MIKKRVFGFLIIALSILTSCKSKKTDEKVESSVRTVVDHTGKTVEIPSQINRIVMSSILPMPSVFCMFTGSAEKLVGMHPSSMQAAKNSQLTKAYPDILKAESGFVQNGAINIEELLKLEPDVVFYVASNTEEGQLYENAGIPAIGFEAKRPGFNAIETYARWIELLEQIFGESEHSREIIEYGRMIEKEVLSRTESLSQSQKPKVMIIYSYDDENMTAGGSNFFSQYWIETCGGVNVAAGLKGQAKINMETVYDWNPDVILITNFASKTAEDLLNNQIEGADWSYVNAVKNGEVYKFPIGMYRWFPPSSDTPLALEWVASKIHPELFSDFDLEKKMKDYYSRFYGWESE